MLRDYGISLVSSPTLYICAHAAQVHFLILASAARICHGVQFFDNTCHNKCIDLYIHVYEPGYGSPCRIRISVPAPFSYLLKSDCSGHRLSQSLVF